MLQCVNDITTLGDAFKIHARRVRTLTISNSYPITSTVDPIVYVLLTERLHGTPLFPGLEAIELYGLPQHFDWHTLPLLLSSHSLRAIKVADSALDNPWFYQFGLPILVSRSSVTLRKLSFCHDTAMVQPSLWKAVASFRRLEELELRLPQSTNMPPEFLFQIGRGMDRLAHLALDVHFPQHLMSPDGLITPNLSDAAGVKGKMPQPSRMFDALKALELVNRMETSLCQCFSIPSLIQHVTSLTLHYTSENAMNSLLQISEHLAKYSSLRTLAITHPKNVNITVYLDQVVSLVSHCERLEELLLNSVTQIRGRGSETAKDCLEQILTASRSPKRPGLRRLELPWFRDVSQISLVDLATLVINEAPQLEQLVVSVHSGIPNEGLVVPPRDPPSETDTRSQRKLASLRICDARDERYYPFQPKQYQQIAHFLDECFPELKKVEPTAAMPAWLIPHWELVDHLRGVYRANRLLMSFH